MSETKNKTHKVLVAPGHSAGWSTWMGAEIQKFALTYEPIIEFIEGGGTFERDETELTFGEDENGRATSKKDKLHPLLKQFYVDAEAKFGTEAHVCVLGADSLEVVTVSGPFRIEEYDGWESVITINDFITLD